VSLLDDITAGYYYPDAADLDPAPDTAQCEGCHHYWPIAELYHDRNGDNTCPDCVNTWLHDHR
jgi:hypothetical protein